MKITSVFCIAVAGAMVIAPAFAAQKTASPLEISHPWSRATPPGATTGAGYLAITNPGKTPDRLVGGSTPVAAKLEIHEMSMTGGVMRMRPVAGGLVIGAGQTVTLKPGGYHLMLIGLKRPLKAGEQVPVTLTFERAGPVKTALDVQATGAAPAAPSHHDMPRMKM